MSSTHWKNAHRPLYVAVRRFSPQWFLICMGTGILSVLMHELPYRFRGLKTISIVFWGLDVVLFLFIASMFASRWAKHTRETWRMFECKVEQTVYFSALTIAIGTILEMFTLVLAPLSASWTRAAFVLFYIDSAISVLVAFVSYWILIRHEHPHIDNLPPTLVYPSIGVIASGVFGAALTKHSVGLSNDAKVAVLIYGYILVGFGLGVALMMISAYTMRLLSYQTPEREKAPASFTVVAPLAEAAWAFISLGTAAKKYFPLSTSAELVPLFSHGMADAVYALSMIASLVLWGFAWFWFLIATIELSRDGFEGGFTLYYWSMVFPIGVFSMVTVEWGKEFNSSAFKRLSVIGCIVTLIAWIVCTVVVSYYLARGRLLGLEEDERREEEMHESSEDFPGERDVEDRMR